jgi:hypothetical protein
MFYEFGITIPANTPASAPVIADLPMTAGKITHVFVQFPAGHLGLTHIFIRDGLFQVWPSNQGADFSTSDETIGWLEEYPLGDPPYDLQAYAWNLDDTYQHTITVRIELQPAEQEPSLSDQIKSLLGIGGA